MQMRESKNLTAGWANKPQISIKKQIVEVPVLDMASFLAEFSLTKILETPSLPDMSPHL